jgi:histidinol phosphatase-like PHP family hydrolase
MFKTEPHAHVLEVSPCSKISARELVELYKNAGYDTLFISDHLKWRFFEKLGDISWEEKVDRFFLGYDLAKKSGDELGLTVLLSAELQLNENSNHYLLYGDIKDFVKNNKDFFSLSIKDFYSLAKRNNITVFQAHPYRDGKTLPVSSDCIDGVEVYNSNPRHLDYSEKTEEFAKKNKLPITAGSDTHRLEDVAKSGVLTEKKIESTKDYIDAVLSGKITIIYGE